MIYELERFIEAQESVYEVALKEIRGGKKVNHWMWFIFPQLDSLGGFSSYSRYYGISCLDEAKEYLKIDYLKNNLIEISEALLSLKTNNAEEVMGSIDSKKLKSCMTLFHEADPNIEVFLLVLNKYYNGQKDDMTLNLLK